MATSPTDELRAKNALLQSESATFEEEEDSAIFNDEAISEDFHDSEEAEDSFEVIANSKFLHFTNKNCKSGQIAYTI